MAGSAYVGDSKNLKVRKIRISDVRLTQFLTNFYKFFGNRIAMEKRIIGNVSGTAGKTEKSETGGRKLAKQSRSGRRRRRRRNKMKAVEGGGLRDEESVGGDGDVEKQSRREQSGTK